MALVRQQKLLSFAAGLAVAGATYVSTQVQATVQLRPIGLDSIMEPLQY